MEFFKKLFGFDPWGVPSLERHVPEMGWTIVNRWKDVFVLSFPIPSGDRRQLKVLGGGTSVWFTHTRPLQPYELVSLHDLQLRNSRLARGIWIMEQEPNGRMEMTLRHTTTLADLNANEFRFVCRVMAEEVNALDEALKVYAPSRPQLTRSDNLQPVVIIQNKPHVLPPPKGYYAN